jgi:hypothetical protein
MTMASPSGDRRDGVGPLGALGADEPGLMLESMTDFGIKALTARAWRKNGLEPERIARLLGVGRSQVYSYLTAVESYPHAPGSQAHILAN